MLMEQLFKLSELETRVPVNINVLVDGVTPRVIGLAEALQQWLDHRRAVLLRRSAHRLAAIERRLELLAGMIVVFLNLDEVIRIIREDDEPKAALMARFSLSETQANYVLDTRLRALRRLEEMALRKEQRRLTEEKGAIEALLASEKKQWQAIAYEIRDVKKKYGPETKLGKRRTTFEAPPEVVVDLAEAMIEREPVTILVSQKGWIRALKGHVADLSSATFKGDDALKTSFFAETTSKILVLAGDGKVFTLDAAKLPGGRGAGEPIRLMADIDEGADIVAVWPYAPGEKMLVAASDGRGFVVGQDEMLSSTRKGRALLNVDAPAAARLAAPAAGDHVAVDRREPQAAGVSARPGAGNGARQGRAPAALQGRRALRRAGVQARRRHDLARFGGADLYGRQGRAQGLDRNARRGGPAAAQGLPQEQPLRGVSRQESVARLPWSAQAGICPHHGFHLLLRCVARRRPQDHGDLRRRAGADRRQRRAVQSAAPDRAGGAGVADRARAPRRSGSLDGRPKRQGVAAHGVDARRAARRRSARGDGDARRAGPGGAARGRAAVG